MRSLRAGCRLPQRPNTLRDRRNRRNNTQREIVEQTYIRSVFDLEFPAIMTALRHCLLCVVSWPFLSVLALNRA